MREIKFRAWHHGGGDSRIDGHMSYSAEFAPVKYFWESLDNEVFSYELMQYTGLKDKNGKEIYCSDIVKGTFDVDSVEDYVYLSLSEKDQKNGYKLFTIPDDIVEFARMALPDGLEVVGNIYENPELLK